MVISPLLDELTVHLCEGTRLMSDLAIPHSTTLGLYFLGFRFMQDFFFFVFCWSVGFLLFDNLFICTRIAKGRPVPKSSNHCLIIPPYDIYSEKMVHDLPNKVSRLADSKRILMRPPKRGRYKQWIATVITQVVIESSTG